MGFEQLLLSGAGILGFFLFLSFAYLLSRYKRCPANKILVIYGSVGKDKNAKCIHGGGTFILPIIQNWKLMSTHPMAVEIDLKDAFSKQNTRINLSGAFKVAISTDKAIMSNAAKYLLDLSEKEIKEQARDIIVGQLRLVISNLTIEEMQQELESFVNLIHKYLDNELNRIGLELINVSIQSIREKTD
jgi:flotillin